MRLRNSTLAEIHTYDRRQRGREDEKLIGGGRTFQHLKIRVPIVPPLLLLPAPSGEKIPSGDRKKHGDIDGRKDQGMTQKRGYIVSPPHGQTDRDIDQIGDQQDAEDHSESLNGCGMSAAAGGGRLQNVAYSDLLRPAAPEHQPHGFPRLGGAKLQAGRGHDALHPRRDRPSAGGAPAHIIIHRDAAALHNAHHGSAWAFQHLDLLSHQPKPRFVHIVTAFHSRNCRLCIACT